MDEQARATWTGALVGLIAGFLGATVSDFGDEVRYALIAVAVIMFIPLVLLLVGVGPFKRPRPVLVLVVGEDDDDVSGDTSRSDFEINTVGSLPFAIAHEGGDPLYGDKYPEYGWQVWKRLIRVDNTGTSPAVGTRVVVANVLPASNVLGARPRPELVWLEAKDSSIPPQGKSYAVLVEWYRRFASEGPAPAYLMDPAKMWVNPGRSVALDLEIWCDGFKEPLRETLEIDDLMAFRPVVRRRLRGSSNRDDQQ